MSSFSAQLFLLQQQLPNSSLTEILVRIRKPTQSELLKYRKIHLPAKSPKQASRALSRGRSSSPSRSPLLAKRLSHSRNSSYLDSITSLSSASPYTSDFPYAVCTTSNTPAQYVIASDLPLPDKLLPELQEGRLL